MKTTVLQPGSFRGMSFACRVIGGQDGRRFVMHQFPGRDETTHDDLGRASVHYKIEAVLSGETWQGDYEALIAACSEPGAGEFVHPDGRRRMVVLASPADYSISSVGEAVVSMDLVETADELPAESLDPLAYTEGYADALDSAASDALDSDLDTDTVGALDEAVTDITDALDSVTEEINDLAPSGDIAASVAKIREMEAAVRDLALAPASLYDAWRDTFESVTDLTTILSIADVYTDLIAEAEADLLRANTDEQEVYATNAKALAVAANCAALSRSAGVVASTTYASFDDAQQAVYDLAERCESTEASATGSATVSAIVDLRGAVTRAVIEQVQLLPRLMDYTPIAVTSAAEVAQRLYQDGTRADEVKDRNHVQHPGFVPVEVLSVLSPG